MSSVHRTIVTSPSNSRSMLSSICCCDSRPTTAAAAALVLAAAGAPPHAPLLGLPGAEGSFSSLPAARMLVTTRPRFRSSPNRCSSTGILYTFFVPRLQQQQQHAGRHLPTGHGLHSRSRRCKSSSTALQQEAPTMTWVQARALVAVSCAMHSRHNALHNQ